MNSHQIRNECRASVIIPTRNRAKLLGYCLESLTRQTIPLNLFEVLVIDNGSTDQTAEVVNGFFERLNLKYFHASEPGLHVGRHEGMRRASTDILIYGDDDIEATPSWIEAIINAFEDPTVVLVGGNNYPKFECSPPDWLEQWWHQPIYMGRGLDYLSVLDFGKGKFDVDPLYIWGCNFSIRKETLMKIGGFHPDGVPGNRLSFRGDGETYVSNRIKMEGWRALFDSNASVFHWVSKDRMTAEYFYHRAYLNGISSSYAEIRNSRGVTMSFAYFHRFISRSKRALKLFIKHFYFKKCQESKALQSIREGLFESYWQGYLFHQKAARSNSEILSWVLRESYL
jgi:glucosyl-dolichyl phosphate glucuronosyltransferase